MTYFNFPHIEEDDNLKNLRNDVKSFLKTTFNSNNIKPQADAWMYSANPEFSKKLGEKVNKNSGTMGVAFTSCTVPAAGKPTFDIGTDEMEFGVGIHGEPGRKREKIQPSKTIVNNMLEAIVDDLKPQKNEKTLLFVNGMGGTPLTELYLVYDDACEILKSKGIEITRSLVGNYCTSLEMQGASITLLKCDDEILKNWDAPVHTAAMRWGM